MTYNPKTVAIEVKAAIATFLVMIPNFLITTGMLRHAGVNPHGTVTTCASTVAFGCIFLGLLTRYPFTLGVSRVITLLLVSHLATFPIEECLGVVFITSILLIILNAIGLREAINEAIPKGIRLGAVAGLGLMLAYLGVKMAAPFTASTLAITGFGLLLLPLLLYYRLFAAPLLTVAILALIGGVLGFVQWDGAFGLPEMALPLFFQLSLPDTLSLEYGLFILSCTLLFLFDAAGSVAALAELGHFVEDSGKLPRIRRVFSADAISSAAAALIGTPPLAFLPESLAGIHMGGKTGLTPIFVGLCFLATLFFTPALLSLPLSLLAPIMIVIGLLIAKTGKGLISYGFNDQLGGIAVLIVTPLTLSITTGLGTGFTLYLVTTLIQGKARELTPLVWLITLVYIPYLLSTTPL